MAAEPMKESKILGKRTLKTTATTQLAAKPIKRTPARKKKVGRTPKDTQAYIEESNAQIEKWTKELDQFYKRGQGNDV